MIVTFRDSEESAPAEFPPEQPGVDEVDADEEEYGKEEREIEEAELAAEEETEPVAPTPGEDTEMGGAEGAEPREDESDDEGSVDLENESDDDEVEAEGERQTGDAEMADAMDVDDNKAGTTSTASTTKPADAMVH